VPIEAQSEASVETDGGPELRVGTVPASRVAPFATTAVATATPIATATPATG
jgi:hypothetical protein